MKKLVLVLAALVPLACNQPMEKEATQTASQPSGEKLAVKEDVARRAAQLPQTVIDYDRSLLGEDDRKALEKLIEASRHIDEIFWLQVDEQNPDYRRRLEAQAGASELDKAGYAYFISNRGRFDRVADPHPATTDRPSLRTIQTKRGMGSKGRFMQR